MARYEKRLPCYRVGYVNAMICINRGTQNNRRMLMRYTNEISAKTEGEAGSETGDSNMTEVNGGDERTGRVAGR